MSEIQKFSLLSPYENLLSISTAENPLSIPAAATLSSIPTAIYCRVSTLHPHQKDSLENQIRHYQEFMKKTPNYILTGIYYDFGISGYKENRPGFCKMLEDARKGCFQQIITKSITRFARNTDTVLKTTRELKELGIDTHLLKIDMSIDLFGWMATLDLVISMADGITEKKTLDETVSSDLEGTKSTSTITEVTKTDKVVEDKEKKTRKRTKWTGILQYSLDGKLVRQWKSITEAAKTLNLNHASISKCVNGTYKKAVGYRWEGIKEPMEDMTSTAAA